MSRVRTRSHGQLGVAASLGAALFGFASPLHATYSIVAADTRTQRTGGAGTSCVDGQDVFIIHGLVPQVGTIHAQAAFNRAARERGTELLAAGYAPDDIITELTSPAFDASASLRQYGIAATSGETAAFTGERDGVFADHHQGSTGTLVYSVQGNILTGSAVIERATEAFEGTGCDLPERLMRALEAGAENGEGDRRCTAERGIPSDSAFLRVSAGSGDGGGEPYVELHVPTSGDANPLVELRSQLDAWRTTHPCDETVAGSPAESAGDPGCGCHLPRGRPGRGLLSCLGVALAWGAARRRGRPGVRPVPSAVSRQ